MASSTTPTASREPPDAWATLVPTALEMLPHDNLGFQLGLVNWVLALMATTFLAFRIYCKLSRRQGLWWDDWILVMSWLAFVIECIITSVDIRMGLGKHSWNISPGVAHAALPLGLMISCTFTVTAAVWGKTSFAVSLLRLMPQLTWTKVLVWSIIFTMNVAMGIAALFPWITCQPLQKAWNVTVQGTCYPASMLLQFNVFSAAYSGTMDFVLTLLSCKVIWGLRMTPKEKCGVAFSMSMGILAGITAMIKVIRIQNSDSSDLYDSVQPLLWSNAEIALTIIAASVPALRVLIKSKINDNPEDRIHPRYKWPADNFELQSRSTVVIESMSRTQHSRRGSNFLWKKDVNEIVDAWKIEGFEEPPAGKVLQIHEVAVEYHDQTDDLKGPGMMF